MVDLKAFREQKEFCSYVIKSLIVHFKAEEISDRIFFS